jgi:hypothetical protein
MPIAHKAGKDEKGHEEGQEHHPPLGEEEEVALGVAVRQNPGGQREEEGGQELQGHHQAQPLGAPREEEDQPALGGGLHPGTHLGGEEGEPVGSVPGVL